MTKQYARYSVWEWIAFIIVSFILCCCVANAQSTTVSVTATDTGGQVWIGGSISYQWTNPQYPNNPTWQGAPLPNNYKAPTVVILDSTGSATFTIPSTTAISPSGALWAYTICPNAPVKVCQTINLPATGNTQNISSQISAILPPVSISAMTAPFAYQDAEVITPPTPGALYFNTISQNFRQWTGTVWTPIGEGAGSFVQFTPSISQTVTQPVGTTLNINSLNTTQINVSSSTFPGADIGAQINAADTFLGSASGTISVNTTGTISTAVNLSVRHNLIFNSPVTIAGLVTLAGSNQISCNGTVTLTVSAFTPFVSTGNDLQLQNCSFLNTGSTVNVFALSTTGSNRVKVNFNTTSNMSLILTSAGSDVEVTNNIAAWSSIGSFAYGVLITGTSNVIINSNKFTNASSAVEYFNADANFNSGGPTSRAQVLAYAGNYVISNNICINSVSCYWGSVAHDVVVTGNYAYNCSDVCYDYEGSIDVLVSGNRGEASTNGVGTMFFFADHNSFIGNSFTSSNGNPIITLHNSSQNINYNSFTNISNNVLDCQTVICQAIVTEAATLISINNNEITSGTISNDSFLGFATVKQNSLAFGLSSSSVINGISLVANIDAANSYILNNFIEGATQPSGSACIFASGGDNSSSTQINISGNFCLGGFPVDIATANTGTAPGTGVTTILNGNWLAHNNVTHTNVGGDTDNYSQTSYLNPTSGNWENYFNNIPTIGTPTINQSACVKAVGPPVVLGYCSTVVSSSGSCTCN